MNKYYVKIDNPYGDQELPWIEVDRKTFVQAEQDAGFFSPAQKQAGTATAGFTGRNIRGKVVYG